MNIYERQWKPMAINNCQWKSMKPPRGWPTGPLMAPEYAYSMRRVCVEYEPGTWMNGKERKERKIKEEKEKKKMPERERKIK